MDSAENARQNYLGAPLIFSNSGASFCKRGAIHWLNKTGDIAMFKRSKLPAGKSSKSAGQSNSPDSAGDFEERRSVPRALPIPVVIEGSEDSDWALWEDSVWRQEFQLQAEKRRLQRPAAVPEAIEGNETSDWALWQESVWQVERQLQFSASPSKRLLKNDAFRSVSGVTKRKLPP